MTRGKNFIICGLTGWCMEIAFTSASALLKKDKTLTGRTSAWMFPIYGTAAVIGDIAPKISHWPPPVRGLFYGSAIMLGEYVSGSVLTKFDVCPWSYKGAKYAVNDIVRLDYLPLWMAAGLFYEHILTNDFTK
ncbi:MAG: hypothetical protein IKJ16_01660 [Agathobacter sp.]|nr:hypothetical protein [Agathobacter sp.]